MNMYTSYLNELLVSIEDTLDEYSQSLKDTDKLMIELYGQYKLVKELIEKFEEMEPDGFGLPPDMLRNVFKYVQDHKDDYHIQSTPHWIILRDGSEIQIPVLNLLNAYIKNDYLYLVNGSLEKSNVQVILLDDIISIRHGLVSLEDMEEVYELNKYDRVMN